MPKPKTVLTESDFNLVQIRKAKRLINRALKAVADLERDALKIRRISRQDRPTAEEIEAAHDFYQGPDDV